MDFHSKMILEMLKENICIKTTLIVQFTVIGQKK